MNYKIYTSILLAPVCLALGLLTGCSNNSSSTTHTIGIAAVAADATQSTVVGAAFPNPLGVTVTDNGSPASGLTVTYSAPSSGASCTLSATTATTDANGQVTSVTCTANGTASSYNVTATVSGAATPANFCLNNSPVPGGTYVFTVSGMEAPNMYNQNSLNYYAIAGVFTTDPNGNIFSGEQDYNDGFGITSQQPYGDSITQGTMMALPGMVPGQYQLTLVTQNLAIGEHQTGVENFIVQFVNTSHALITQFDGSATSSGSMDLQTVTSISAGSFALTMAGVDINYFPVGYGGVFSVSGGNIVGTVDADDDGSVTLGAPLAGVAGETDPLGRGQITGVSITTAAGTAALSLNYYVISPKVIRIIDVDPGTTAGTGNAMLGSAFGQGSGSFSTSSVGASVFGMEQVDPFGYLYATAGMWGKPVSGTSNIAGFADLDAQSGVSRARQSPAALRFRTQDTAALRSRPD